MRASRRPTYLPCIVATNGHRPPAGSQHPSVGSAKRPALRSAVHGVGVDEAERRARRLRRLGDESAARARDRRRRRAVGRAGLGRRRAAGAVGAAGDARRGRRVGRVRGSAGGSGFTSTAGGSASTTGSAGRETGRGRTRRRGAAAVSGAASGRAATTVGATASSAGAAWGSRVLCGCVFFAWWTRRFGARRARRSRGLGAAATTFFTAGSASGVAPARTRASATPLRRRPGRRARAGAAWSRRHRRAAAGDGSTAGSSRS